MIKRVISGVTAICLLASMSFGVLSNNISICTSNVYAEEPVFNYTNEDCSDDSFVADYLYAGAYVDGESYISKTRALTEDMQQGTWLWEQFAKELVVDNYIKEPISTLWNDNTYVLSEYILDADIDGALNWQKYMYIELLLDYINYNEDSTSFKSSFQDDVTKYTYKIDKEVKKHLSSDENIQSVLKTMTIEEAQNMDLKFKVFDNFTRIADNATTVFKDCTDYFKRVAQFQAFQEASIERMEFLEKLYDTTDNNYLKEAISYVSSQYTKSLNELSFDELGYTMLRETSKQVGKVFKGLLKDLCPTAGVIIDAIELGKAGIDFFFNAKEIANARVKMTILYHMHNDIKETYRYYQGKYSYPCGGDESARDLINAYDMYLQFHMYANNFCITYLGETMIEGVWNEFTNVFTNNYAKYNDFVTTINSQQLVLAEHRNYIDKGYAQYNRLFHADSDLSVYDFSQYITSFSFDQHEITIELPEKPDMFDMGLVKMAITPENVSNKAVTFTSSDESVAKVDDLSEYPNLWIMPVSVGTAEITATTENGGFTDTVKVTVVDEINEDTPVVDESDFEYILLDNGAIEIRKYKGSASELSIPAIINGKRVTIIGDGAFYKCSSLKKITIPASVTIIRRGAFQSCYSLTSISVDSKNNYYSSDNSILYNKNKTELIRCPYGKTGSVTIPDSVLSIGDSAFFCCTSLSSVTIPDSVTSIGHSAFDGCTSLSSVTIPDSVTSIGYSAFAGCTSLTSVNIPDSVTSIDDWVFEDCSSLTSIMIPDSVTSIGHSAFAYCTSLTSVTIPSSVTSIGSYVFYNTSWLTEMRKKTPLVIINNIVIDGLACEGDIIIPNGVKSISSFAFWDVNGYNKKITSVTIPDSVSSIGEEAFADCTNITNIIIPKSVTEIGYKAFGYYDEKKIDEFTIYGYKGTAAEDYAVENGFVFVALDNPVHEHAYTSNVTTTATCTKDGVRTYICSCGDCYTEVISKTGHSYTSKITKPAACTEDGVRTYTCSTCNDTYTETIKATGHSYETKVVAPTCTEKGYTLHTCKNCGNNYKDTYVDAIGHWYEATVVVPPTTTSQGYTHYICSVCGDEYDDDLVDPIKPEIKVDITFNTNDKNLKTEDVTVALDSEKVAVSENGSAQLTGLTDGEHKLTFAAPNFVTRTYTVTVKGGAIVEDIAPELNLVGDITGDGKLNTADLLRAKSHIKCASKLTGYELDCANIDGNDKVNAADLLKMKAHIKGVSKLWA